MTQVTVKSPIFLSPGTLMGSGDKDDDDGGTSWSSSSSSSSSSSLPSPSPSPSPSPPPSKRNKAKNKKKRNNDDDDDDDSDDDNDGNDGKSSTKDEAKAAEDAIAAAAAARKAAAEAAAVALRMAQEAEAAAAAAAAALEAEAERAKKAAAEAAAARKAREKERARTRDDETKARAKEVSHASPPKKKKRSEDKTMATTTTTTSSESYPAAAAKGRREHKNENRKDEGTKKKNWTAPEVTDDDSNNDHAMDENGNADAANSAPEPCYSTHTVLPTSDPRGNRFIEAVKRTRSHHFYDATYDYERYKAMDVTDGSPHSWVKAPPYKQGSDKLPLAIAIDCEMVGTRNALTGKTDDKALCRLSIVDASDPTHPEGGALLLDTLVKPDWPVVEMRTAIHGIHESDLRGVQFTLEHAQQFLLSIMTEQTVVAGHAVNNDLASLRFEHGCVADTSFLYRLKDEGGRTPALKDVYRAISGKDMPQTHCSVNDSRVSLACLNHWIEKDGNVEPVERVNRFMGGAGGMPVGGETFEDKGDTLFVRGIVRTVKPEDVKSMFLNETGILPMEMTEIGSNVDRMGFGYTFVTFMSQDHAKLAFDSIRSDVTETDQLGYMQKKVQLGRDSYAFVRSKHAALAKKKLCG